MSNSPPFIAEPWKEVMPRKCKVVGADPGPAGTGALVGLVLIALAVFALEKKMQ